MKEKFTPAEWEDLKTFPFIAFRDIAFADREMDEKELAEFIRSLNTELWTNPLLRELITDIIALSDLGELAGAALKGGPEAEDLKRIRHLLRGKLTTDECQAFLESILQQAAGVARATGGFLGRGRISEEEKRILGYYAMTFDMDPEVVKRLISG